MFWVRGAFLGKGLRGGPPARHAVAALPRWSRCEFYIEFMEQCRLFFSALILACAGAWAAHPFQLSPQLDIPLAVGATGAAAFGQYRLSGMEPRDTSFKRSDLFFWDRPVAGNWNSQAALASDLLTGAGALPLVLGAVAWKNGDASGSDFATQSLMLYEVLALQSGINLTVRSLRVWPRPFTLGTHGGDERNEGQAAGSFYSGHSSAAFSIAVFSGVWFDAVYPNSQWSPWVWGGGLSTAALVGVLRIVAGKHYPTDVVVGAMAGSLIGWAVPTLHKSSRSSSSADTQPQAKATPSQRAWLRWHGLAVAPDYVGWQCGF